MALFDLLKKDNKSRNSLKRKERNDSSKSLTNNSHGLLSSNITRQFYITFAEPHRIWKPNEHIIGEATLEIKKDITNIAIRLSLICEMKVKTRGNSPTTLMAKKTVRLIERSTFLYGFDMTQENILKQNHQSMDSTLSSSDQYDEVKNNNCLIDKDGNIKTMNGLTKGIHKFPFRIKLPKNNKKLFSSIKFERGSIDYYMQCTLEPLSSTQSEKTYVSKCKNEFEVIVPLDVSYLPIPKTKTVVLQSFTGTPMVHKKSNSSGDAGSSLFSKLTNKSNDSTGSGSLSTKNDATLDKTVAISVGLPRSGYIMGEVIPVKISVDHYKPYYHAAGVIATLVRICRVGTNNETEGIAIEKFRKDICQCVSPLYIDPETLRSNVLAHLKVPLDAFATFNPPNQLFSFQYYIEVMVNLSRKNLVYTESNKILGGAMDENDEEIYQNMNNKFKTNKISSSKLFGIDKSIQQKVSALVTSTDNKNELYEEAGTISMNDSSDHDSKILYKDMVNVESLKGMRNVTGMSIEIVVGTVKENIKPDRLEPISNISSTQENQTRQNIVSDHERDTIQKDQEINVPSLTTSELNSWLSSYPVHDNSLPLPEYSPRETSTTAKPITISEDKQELERLRLQELESEPPESY
ncbi:similar to Saccharomyces cerevisiae YGL045W RIM8 Protein involved in proteolytic activation of Rim101p in response to alkaline pH [Maudiozyma saulgeensis]|uniref:pH-response regulator protein palF/RIM8 n=1 Tax=Maudiozyma saulgeensis TaxID=1789683 RepID=A0A1X7R8J2_9SACH|nr:similar to Saccharomyces cerevisiae YGL045W RIM8 Protein involved in proteolytic activation of Rim101p in response to alkaline pH [Kazachstania saulgeensis]